MPKTYVRKICSLNQTKYKIIPLEDAINEYAKYVISVVTSRYGYKTAYKSFKQWLTTEI